MPLGVGKEVTIDLDKGVAADSDRLPSIGPGDIDKGGVTRHHHGWGSAMHSGWSLRRKRPPARTKESRYLGPVTWAGAPHGSLCGIAPNAKRLNPKGSGNGSAREENARQWMQRW